MNATDLTRVAGIIDDAVMAPDEDNDRAARALADSGFTLGDGYPDAGKHDFTDVRDIIRAHTHLEQEDAERAADALVYRGLHRPALSVLSGEHRA